jgi:hypothetical protein
MADQSRHKSMDTLRGYVRDAEIFKDRAGRGYSEERIASRSISKTDEI